MSQPAKMHRLTKQQFGAVKLLKSPFLPIENEQPGLRRKCLEIELVLDLLFFATRIHILEVQFLSKTCSNGMYLSGHGFLIGKNGFVKICLFAVHNQNCQEYYWTILLYIIQNCLLQIHRRSTKF
jgi:hypothetical protein